MRKVHWMFLAFALSFLLMSNSAMAKVAYIESKPLAQVIHTPVGPVKSGSEQVVNIITWGADMATIHGNGDSDVTMPGSIMAKEGLKLKLVREDDFKKQVEAYLSGETSYLRGTLDMIMMAMEVINKDPRTKPVFLKLLSFSAGGDNLVVKEGINSVSDLRGKTIVLQAYGPHVYFLTQILKDAGLSIKDVKIKWVRDITGTDNSPAEALYEKDVDAVFVITPDAMKLTSNGKVGTGSEGSVKGAKILMSTRTANRVIGDVYVVRSDYYQANRKAVEGFTHALMLSEQKLRETFRNKDADKAGYKKMISVSAKILLDSDQAASDAEGLYGDCEMSDFGGNVQFFTDNAWPRNFNRMTDEIQTALIGLGMLSKKIPAEWANWDFNALRAGLNGTESVKFERFNQQAVAKVVAQKQESGALSTGALFSFEVGFKPNQNDFPAELYAAQFDDAINKAATYSGAVITIEGHTDVLGFLKKKKEGAPDVVLTQQKQSAKNLSVGRANAVRDALIKYASAKGISLDPSQFTVVGHGISQPKTGMCGGDPCPPKTEQEWLSNMRVVFQLYNVEAEADVFKPLQ